MEPKEFDFEFPRGDTCPVSFSLLDSNGNALEPTTGDEIYFTMKKNYNSSSFLLQKKYSNGDITFNGNVGYLVIQHTDTSNLPYGNYVYDIELMSGDLVKTLVKGTITLTKEATFIENE